MASCLKEMKRVEWLADQSVRDTVVAALHVTDLLPVPALVEIVLRYTLPFRGVVSTLWAECQTADGVPSLGPFAVRVYSREPTTLLVCDVGVSRIFRFSLDTGTGTAQRGRHGTARHGTARHGTRALTVSLASSRAGVADMVVGKRFKSEVNPPVPPTALDYRYAFTGPFGLCVDPTNTNRWFVADSESILRLDFSSGAGGRPAMAVTVIAGCSEEGWEDGTGSTARFSGANDVICTSDGTTLLVCDMNNHRLRSIHVKSCEVITVAGSGKALNRDGIRLKASLSNPQSPVFDRMNAKPEAVLFVTCNYKIVRFERSTGEVRAIPFQDNNHIAKFEPCGLLQLPNGLLLFTCSALHSLYAIDPANGRVERLAGKGESAVGTSSSDGSSLSEAAFNHPRQFCALESERCVIIADSQNGCLRRVPLPPDWFVPPAPAPALKSSEVLGRHLVGVTDSKCPLR